MRVLREEMKKHVELTTRLRMVENVQPVLSMYADRLTQSKMESLRHTAAACFTQLCRKGDLIQRLEVDPCTFEVTLYDQQNRPLPKDDLSAGEKQIYAISMLWGLAKTSGRPLPMIIDTPLGRLDSDHRKNLIERYFPEVSHQVMILSTDTELDRYYFEMLLPHISHACYLEYDPVEGATTSREGYFFKIPKEEVVYAH